MAEIRGRLTGNPAGCLGALGPGATNVHEMETARLLNANSTVMVWEDGGYGLIQW